MGFEIERKFLVKISELPIKSKGVLYIQGYLVNEKDLSIRVRLGGNKGYITFKRRLNFLKKLEYEYEISYIEAKEILRTLCKNRTIKKYRYIIRYKGQIFELDKFIGNNRGLYICEIELDRQNKKIILPKWIEKEVTGDSKYSNSNLINNPFMNWN